MLCVISSRIASLAPKVFLSNPPRSWKIPPRGLMLSVPLSPRCSFLDVHDTPSLPFFKSWLKRLFSAEASLPSSLTEIASCHATPSPRFIHILNFHSPPPITSRVGFLPHFPHRTVNFLRMGASSALLTVPGCVGRSVWFRGGRSVYLSHIIKGSH